MKQTTLKLSWITLGPALLLRLMLMPIAFHPDLVFIQYYPTFFWTHGVWDFYGSIWGEINLESFGNMYYPPLTFYLIAFSEGVSRLNPSFVKILSTYHELFVQNPRFDFIQFFGSHSLQDRLLFTFWSKWFYLLMDCVTFAVFVRFFKDSKERKIKFLNVWLWSPVLLFSTYLFGQYRIITAFFMTLMLVFLTNRKRAAAFFCLGCGALLDHFPWALFLPYILIFLTFDKKSIRSLIALALPVVLVLGPLAISSQGKVAYAYGSPLYVQLGMTGIINAGGIWTAYLTRFLMALGYGLLILGLLYFRKAILKLSFEEKWKLSIDITICVLLLLYATGRTSAHYFMWILPFWIYRHTLAVPWPKTLSILAVALLFFFNLDNREMNMGLFLPLDPEYWMSVPSLHEIMDQFLPWGKMIGLARVLFSFLCLFFIYRICRELLKKLKGRLV